jgi:hypothetical protein
MLLGQGCASIGVRKEPYPSSIDTFAASLDTAGRGNAPATVSSSRRGVPVIPGDDDPGVPPDFYKEDDVRDPITGSSPYNHYGQLGDITISNTSAWHFFAVNLVPTSANNAETDIHNGRCRFIDTDDTTQIGGSFSLTNYISENNDGNGDPSGQHRLFARQETYPLLSSDYGPIANYCTTGGTGCYRIFIGRVGADTGSWVNPFRGQISRFFIYTKDQLLTHDQIVAYYNNTCPIFIGNSNCIYTSP